MQAFKNLFARTQVQAAAATSGAVQTTPAQPTELTPEAMALVGGGLPRVGGLGGSSVALPPAESSVTTQPSVS
ncbi:hypothetical protein [Rubrivivax rivuli]|uniref:Uncharacterized protein n=1 Tax=Rubrivivax rivuli TaxID=1862385 RepID=A0A437RRP3_9BURK|nr:hypothetical protein [Rubrivivax rivuli]RVU49448.1 hypothetical protein EOE66_02430 [Rubrivivax rivuli]